MKKNIRDYKRNGKQFAYILDSINGENYDLNLTNDKEKINFFFATFDKEYNHDNNKKRIPNLQDRINDFLRCIPSCIDLPFWPEDIKKTLISLGVKNTERKDLYDLVNNWYSHTSSLLIQIANYYNIDLCKFI